MQTSQEQDVIVMSPLDQPDILGSLCKPALSHGPQGARRSPACVYKNIVC